MYELDYEFNKLKAEFDKLDRHEFDMDDFHIDKLLSGLPSRYDPLVLGITSRCKDKKFRVEDVKGSIRRLAKIDEALRLKYGPSEVVEEAAPAQRSAFAQGSAPASAQSQSRTAETATASASYDYTPAINPDTFKQFFKGLSAQSLGPSKEMPCFFCASPGHWADRCPKAAAVAPALIATDEGAPLSANSKRSARRRAAKKRTAEAKAEPTGSQPKAPETKHSKEDTIEQFSADDASSSLTVTERRRARRKAGKAKAAARNFADLEPPERTAPQKYDWNKEDHWILGSAADSHMTGDASLLSGINMLPSPVSFSFNGVKVQSAAFGTASFLNHMGKVVHISPVYYVPRLTANCMSMHELGQGVEVRFGVNEGPGKVLRGPDTIFLTRFWMGRLSIDASVKRFQDRTLETKLDPDSTNLPSMLIVEKMDKTSGKWPRMRSSCVLDSF